MYASSNKHTGPWLGECERPDQALSKGRALWGERSMIYVAEIAPLDPAIGLPNAEVLIGDCREFLVEKYGAGADEIFDNNKVMTAISDWWGAVTEHQFRMIIQTVADLDFMVATKLKAYSPGNNVKVADFKE